jgi:hypothetical protein
MAYDIIKKNVFYDAPNVYPHDGRNHFDDFQDYHDPLARQHHAAIHDRGIAAGFEVSGAPGDGHVSINPGVCVDGPGRLIVLSTSGKGDIGGDPPGGNSQEAPVPVQLPLAAQAGNTVYVTIQYSTLRRVNEGSGGRLEQVPWVRLQPTAGAGAYVDDGSSVILGIVKISAAGTITTLSATDNTLPYGRRSLGEPVSELRVRRSQSAANQLSEALSGRVSPGPSGGLQVTVPNSTDTVLFSRDGGTHCASVETRADTSVWKDGAGRDVVHIDTNGAWLRIGANGNEGDLIVQTQNGGTGFAFDGSACRLDIGGGNVNGHLYMRNGAGGITAHIDGGNSSVNANNLNPWGQEVMNVGSRFFRVHGWDLCLDGRSGGNQRALVDANQKLVINYANDYANGVQVNSDLQVDKILRDGNGISLMGNPVSKVAVQGLFALNNTPQLQDVDLGSPRNFFAFATLAMVDSLTNFDSDNAPFVDVFMIDGVPTGSWVTGEKFGNPGDITNMHFPSASGTARIITFRIWPIGPDIAATGLGIVFFE